MAFFDPSSVWFLLSLALFLGVHNLEQAEKDQEELLNAAIADQEADDEDDADEDDDAYDSGSGFPSALTPPDSPPYFEVRKVHFYEVNIEKI